MNDDKIMESLEACDNCFCENCSYKSNLIYCREELCKDALELINRQREEIEKLRKEIITLKYDLRVASEESLEWKSTAIKEFAERLKDKIIADTAYGCDCNQHSGYYDYTMKIGDIPEYINGFVKEMTEVEE